MTLKRDIDYLCSACHKLDASLSHPSNLHPSMKLPSDFPLDWQGRMTCVTCHRVHLSDSVPEADSKFRLRRALRGRELCQLCHADLFTQGFKKHASYLETAHLVKDKNKTRGFLDEMSLQCLGCHDGTVSMDTHAMPERPVWDHGGLGNSHPVGVEFPRIGRKAREYRSPDMLDPRIKLFDGKVGCGSCHSPYSKEGHGLVMSNQRSALCLQCHTK